MQEMLFIKNVFVGLARLKDTKPLTSDDDVDYYVYI